MLDFAFNMTESLAGRIGTTAQNIAWGVGTSVLGAVKKLTGIGFSSNSRYRGFDKSQEYYEDQQFPRYLPPIILHSDMGVTLKVKAQYQIFQFMMVRTFPAVREDETKMKRAIQNDRRNAKILTDLLVGTVE